MSKGQGEFPAFRAQLAPMRAASERVAATKELHSLEALASKWLPSELLKELESIPGTRNRWLPLKMVFWACLNMVLHPGAPCREAQRSIQAWWTRLGRNWRNPCTSAFCTARSRLPMAWLRRLWLRVAESMANGAPCLPGCHGRRVLVVDGTSVTTPDTAENQKQWPQPSFQKPGCGWPLISMVGIFCLSSGALVRAAHGAWKTSEARMFAFLRRMLRWGDILVADRGYFSFANLAFLPMRGVDLIVRGRHAKRVNWRKGKRLGKGDRLVTMLRPADKNASKVMSKRLWRKLPETINVRQIRAHAKRPGFRTEELLLVTTLLEVRDWPAETLIRVYLRRWRVELNFDDIKTTMQASAMRCLSPEAVRRELLMHAIAYNLIRRVMLESARQELVPLDQISFKGTLDTVRHWQHAIAAKRGRAARAQTLEEMLALCARDLLPVRPGRSEPRAVKRRPKPYQYLTSPRRKMVVSPSRDNKGTVRKSPKPDASHSLN
jgi:hypothetical protein